MRTEETIQEQSGQVVRHQCPLCQSDQITTLLDMNSVPVLCNVLWSTREEAERAPRGNISLSFCSGCGHVFNRTFDPALMEYTQVYENSLHFSPRFQQYADELAERLVNDYDLRGKDIIEIGSGKGDFLRMLCAHGGNRGLGFDPSHEPDLTTADDNVRFIPDIYTEKYAGHQADFIVCRHVLEHIEQPRLFIESMRRSIGDRSTVVYFEVPNVAYTLRDMGIWDLIYEHFSYFSTSSLARLFIECGFKVLNLSEVYGGQFLSIEATLETAASSAGASDLPLLVNEASAFAERYRQKVSDWQKRLSDFAVQNKRVVIWGGGSKGVTFLNTLPTHSVISYAVDINPRKIGKYVAGSGQLLVAPEFLRDYQPDIVLIMNPLYQDEIRQMLDNLGIFSELIVV